MERFFGSTVKKRTTVPDNNDIIALACRRPRLSRMILSRGIKKLSEIADSSNSSNNLSSNSSLLNVGKLYTSNELLCKITQLGKFRHAQRTITH